jgi:flagellar basal body rod protein FlgB
MALKEFCMKNKYIILLILAFGAAFFMSSCKSTAKPVPATLTDTPPVVAEPVPAPSPAPQDVPDQAALNSLAAAKARVENARQKTIDFESPSYFSGEWEAAEADYASAGKLSPDTLTRVKQAEAQYNAAADSFEGIFQKAIPPYAQDWENAVIAARDEAISAGVKELVPDVLLDADMVALDAVDKYEAKDYYAAKDSAAAGLAMYQALKTGMDAYNVRQEIVSRNFADYDPDNFNRADETLVAAADLYEAGNVKDAQNGAGEAKTRYDSVLKIGWIAYTKERADAAGKERQNALDLKANVAVRSEFDPVERLYSQAGASLKAEKYEESAGLYIQTESRFISLTQTAAEKRRVADEAIRTAEEKMTESDENARDAELILEGGV